MSKLIHNVRAYTLNSSLAVMQNFATFEWLLWQQGSLGGTIRLPDPENRG